MITTTRLAFAAALALSVTAACGATPQMGGDDGGGGSGDQPPSSRPLDATGTYTVHSTFDLATNMPGTAGTVVNAIIDATDDPDDPTKWILEQLANQFPAGSFEQGLILDAETLAGGALNDELLRIAPDFVSTMVQVGQDFGDLAKHVGLDETLALTQQSAGNYLAAHTVLGLHYELGNQQGDLAFSNYQLPDVVVDNVAVTMDSTGQLTIAAHDLPLSYGKLLRLGLDAAIIPEIDASAHNLGDLLVHKIDCKAVGQAIANAVDASFAAGVLSSACATALSAGAGLIYGKIDAIDSTALKFSINGSARGVDTNSDRQVDTIQTGTWAGTLAYGTTPTPLIPATFFGERQ